MFKFFSNLFKPKFPPVTDEMSCRGLTWARTTDGKFIEVCDFCGGNCGQCGITSRVGNVPFNMDRMVKKLQGER